MTKKKPKRAPRLKLDELRELVEDLKDIVTMALQQQDAVKADMQRINRRLEFLDQHVTAQNVRSLTIRLGKMETNLTTIRDNVDIALLGLHRAPMPERPKG